MFVMGCIAIVILSTNKCNVAVKVSAQIVCVIWMGGNLISDCGFMLKMSWISSRCVGMYMWMISHGCSGWLFIRIIWRCGEIFAGVGILVMLPGKAYLLCMSVSSPPLPCV